MKKFTNDQIEADIKSGKIDITPYKHWSQINMSLIKFSNKSNMVTFSKLFTPYQEAKRLWDNFIEPSKCNRNINKFLTYLTQEQKNELIYNAHENQSFLYS